MICECCKTREANAKKRPVCKFCYTELHKQGMLDQFPPTPDFTFKERLVSQYGQSIIDDLQMRKFGNLTAIGRKYGFTREYARQAYEKVFGFKYTVIRNQLKANRTESHMVVCLLKKDPRKKLTSYTVGSHRHKGAVAEARVLEICSSLGYEVKPYTPDMSIDLIINGNLVEVKSCYKSKILSPNSITPYCRFHILPSQRKADFMVCHMVEKNRFFVIPRKEYTDKNMIYIPISPSTQWGRNIKYISHNHWYEYLEAWHLLKHQQEVIFSRSLAANPASDTLTTPNDSNQLRQREQGNTKAGFIDPLRRQDLGAGETQGRLRQNTNLV